MARMNWFHDMFHLPLLQTPWFHTFFSTNNMVFHLRSSCMHTSIRWTWIMPHRWYHITPIMVYTSPVVAQRIPPQTLNKWDATVRPAEAPQFQLCHDWFRTQYERVFNGIDSVLIRGVSLIPCSTTLPLLHDPRPQFSVPYQVPGISLNTVLLFDFTIPHETGLKNLLHILCAEFGTGDRGTTPSLQMTTCFFFHSFFFWSHHRFVRSFLFVRLFACLFVFLFFCFFFLLLPSECCVHHQSEIYSTHAKFMLLTGSDCWFIRDAGGWWVASPSDISDSKAETGWVSSIVNPRESRCLGMVATIWMCIYVYKYIPDMRGVCVYPDVFT